MKTIHEVLAIAAGHSGQGAHPNRPHPKVGAGGFSGIVREPTLMSVGEGGREERVSVTPIGSTGHSGGSGGGRPLIIHNKIILNGKEIAEAVTNDINAFQGAFK